MARSMGAIVGSAVALEELHAEPHLDEACDWTDISDKDMPLVRTLLDLIERPSPVGAGNGDTDQHAHTRDNQPVQSPDGNLVQLRSRPATVRWAAKGATEEGRTSILVAFGEGVDDLELVALSVPDARRLLSVVQQALAEPMANDAMIRV